MIELPGWNDLISVNGFCYSSSMGESPKLNIPLKTSTAPTKGIAPATFARNSTATYIDDDGLVQTAGIGVIRFQNGRYLCELAATNLLKDSEDLTSINWLASGVNVVSDANKGSFKVTNLITGNCYLKSSYISFTSGVYYTQSVEFEKGNTNFASITFFSSFSPVLLPYAVFNLDTGVLVKEVNCTATIEEYTVGKYRCSVTAQAAATVTVEGIIITPCRENSLRLQGAAGGYIYANRFQVETGTKATSYIPTTTTPMGRVADTLHYTVGDAITQGQGSLYCEGVVKLFGLNQRLLNLSDNSTANRLYITLLANATLAAYVVSAGTVQASISFGVPTEGDVVKCLLTYQNNNVSFYVNGVAVGTDITCQIPIVLNKLSVGCSHDNSLQLGSEVGNIKYFKEVLTSAQAIKLTTL